MMDWWNLHPITAPLPKGFMDGDTSHKETRDWMQQATLEIERLRAVIKYLDVCCCGDTLLTHPGTDQDHTPRSMFEYAITRRDELIESLRAQIPDRDAQMVLIEASERLIGRGSAKSEPTEINAAIAKVKEAMA